MSQTVLCLSGYIFFIAWGAGCSWVLDNDKTYHERPVSGGSSMSGGSGGEASSAGTGGSDKCVLGDRRCNGNSPEECGENGWLAEPSCPAETPQCNGGACSVPVSCQDEEEGANNGCGAGGIDACCASIPLEKGTYNRANDPMAPASVSAFRLDRFETTVGRFRQFVEAYPASRPIAGAGARPGFLYSGWDDAWDGALPADKTLLKVALKCDSMYGAWTDVPADNETRPINCVTWYEAFAFCAWDGGRLATEAEWNFAAAGGAEQRLYPWPGMLIDTSFASYHCTGDGSPAGTCALSDILSVGAKSPKGDARWGHADLAGNVWEWTLDWHSDTYTTPCDNCANTNPSSYRVTRSGSFVDIAETLKTPIRGFDTPSGRTGTTGFRCARDW